MVTKVAADLSEERSEPNYFASAERSSHVLCFRAGKVDGLLFFNFPGKRSAMEQYNKPRSGFAVGRVSGPVGIAEGKKAGVRGVEMKCSGSSAFEIS